MNICALYGSIYLVKPPLILRISVIEFLSKGASPIMNTTHYDCYFAVAFRKEALANFFAK